MTIEEAAQLRPGARIHVKRDRQKRIDTATVIERPSEYHAAPGLGFLWVRFDGAGIDEIRQYTIHAREVKALL